MLRVMDSSTGMSYYKISINTPGYESVNSFSVPCLNSP